MNRKIHFIMLLLVVAIVSAVRASPDPATAPAALPETPRNGLKAYNSAMKAQDMDGMLARTHGPTEDAQRVAKAMARSDAHTARLLNATRDKFGALASTSLGKAIGDASDAEIDAGTERITGNSAIVTFPNGGSTGLILVDGIWKVDITAMIKNADGNVELLIEAVSRVGNRAKVVAQEVADGKYKRVDQVIDRMARGDAAAPKN
jgi:hypothetical protein